MKYVLYIYNYKPGDDVKSENCKVTVMDPGIKIQILQKWPTRCNCVEQFIIPLFLDCSTCFERYYRPSSRASKL